MNNERITENLVRELLRSKNYFSEDNGIQIEEQKTRVKRIQTLLKTASKSLTGKPGYPEFIITWDLDPNFVILIECKAQTKFHESANCDNPKDFAVDGVLHYAKYLSKDFSVLAIAASGMTNDSLIISNFIVPKGSDIEKDLVNESGLIVNEILTFNDYYRLSSFDPLVERSRHEDLMRFSKELHELLWTAAKISEEDKPLLVSGTLIALNNKPFAKSFEYYSSKDMPRKWLEAVKDELDSADIPKAKKDAIIASYAVVANQPNLGEPDAKVKKNYPNGVMFEVISKINEKVWPFISIYHNFDVVGHFYGEFLKYTGGDKKALGIVLTPRHITELFCDIANVTKKDTVIDICAGTGGFLISAMQAMLRTAISEEERSHIKKYQLIGIENSPKMFSLAASNMILRGDGKANLHQSSCFEDSLKRSIIKPEKSKGVCRPNIGLLNPPFAQAKTDVELHELYFVKEMLDMLVEGGIGVAILPVSCVISANQAKHDILKYHTLKAVMSMPSELFYPVGTVTCIVVFEAHRPHLDSKSKTWFGYWRDDGFVKTSHMGRIDLHHRWEKIKERWIESYRNKEIHPGESVTAYVTAADEWIAEAYLETDYSKITKEDFEATVRNYAMFKLIHGKK
ncbi:N-6 DNA methylase [Klebsiella pneumoniae]|mgnify:CR=1 FL=1|uniref:HsdM family class I SAM-dependent methyltransferase n=1 Tax=Klebsiella TaxID=570 RepID=UPI000DE8AE57|nr:N-6 DNA methylase [Klebsiella pneumoniae]HDT5144272.1 SAM-dependent DNA methyltransferase [Klebsiella michiganensis]RBQ56395.1 SAM-dependent methyltransferase [Klebsiella pneumoniae]SVL01621.1 N-6 DNA methylase [Klebsiella pneumoniae]HBR2661804.1 SAM-dependent DNA methyltransferase [Klebsiella pneumoniae]HBR7704705.1 SAM-dependent DNA methyltransferase [Klebsiella pneumoniae]